MPSRRPRCSSRSRRRAVKAWTSSSTRRWHRAARTPTIPSSTASCTAAASRTRTGTSGRSCGWTSRPSRAKPERRARRRSRDSGARVLEREPEGREYGLDVGEERELDDPAVLDLHDLQRPRLIAVAVGLRPILAEGRRSVRRRGRNDTRIPACVPRPEPPGEDVLAPGEPEVERWHRLRRVLVDERGQSAHVVCLERRDVALEKLGIGGLDGGSGRRLRRVARLERRAGSLQRTVDRGDARLEKLGDLDRLPAEHLAEDEHRALPWRQLLERGDEGEPHGLAGADDLGRIAGLGYDAAVRHRLDPELVGRAQVLENRRAGRPEIHGARAALPALEHVEAHVRRDPVQPRTKSGAALEAVVRAPRADERLLHRVFGVCRAEHAIAVGGQLDAVLLELRLELRGERRRRRHQRMVRNARQRPTSGRTRSQMSSTPASGVRPCGVPSSTRSAPASQSSTTRAATSSGAPAMQKRSRRGSSPGSRVGSCRATTSRYGWTTSVARAFAQSASSSTTVTQPTTSRTSALPIQPRTTGSRPALAVPPILTSSATAPAQRAVSGPQVPIMSGTRSRKRGYASAVPGASVKRSPATPDSSLARSA